MKKVIGIDLGGTSICGGVIDESGKLLKTIQKDTYSDSGKINVLNRIVEVIEGLLEDDILGVGIGSPGFIDFKKGKVLEVGGNIKDWANTDIKSYIEKSFPNLPIIVDNDANVAAICEKWLGGAKSLKSFIMITLGTGVGGAIYLEKHGFLRGERYQAGELGHVILYPFGKRCNCGQNGCAERYISGSAIESMYKERLGKYEKGKNIFKEKSNNQVKEIIDEFTKNLAIFLVSLKNIFDPEGFIIGGGVINSREYWWNDMIKNYKDFSNNSNDMTILPASYLNNAGMIGAAKNILDTIS